MLKSTVIVLAAAALTGSGPCNTPTDTAPDKLIGMWGGENAVAYVEDTVVHVHIRCTVGHSNQIIQPEPRGQTEPAERLAARTDPARDRLFARVAAVWSGEMQGLSDWIGHHPEVGWHEFQAFDTLTAVLRGYGFKVDTGVAGLPTAFTAVWTS